MPISGTVAASRCTREEDPRGAGMCGRCGFRVEDLEIDEPVDFFEQVWPQSDDGKDLGR